MSEIMYKVYRDPERRVFDCTLLGYKGQTEFDTGMFYAPYWPGMSDEDRLRVDAELAFQNRPTTEIQQRIMDMVREGTLWRS